MEKETLRKANTWLEIIDKVIKFWLPVVVWASFIFLLSSRPTNPVSQIYWKDFIVKKSAHLLEYGLLTILLYRALKKGGVEKQEAGVYSIILSVLYGVSDEFHQSFTPGRDPTVRDVLFDTIGSVLAVYVLWKYLPKAPKRLKSLAKRLQLI